MKKLQLKKLQLYIPVIFLILITLIFTYGIFFYQYSPNSNSNLLLSSPTKEHILGTDDLGIDIFAQLSSGFFYSMIIGSFTAIISGILGLIIGTIGGYFEGRIKNFVDFIISIALSIPQLPILIVIGAFFKPRLSNLIIVLSIFSWAPIARVIKGNVENIKNKGYIKMSRAYGASYFHIFKNHILKDIYPLVSISTLKVIGKAIVQESSLAFLGLSDPTSKTWGLMINYSINFKGIYFTQFWKWWLMPPVMLLTLTILSLTMINRYFEIKTLRGEEIGTIKNKEIKSSI
ncbi:ABC transporter permease [Romboutsia sedimentorum]|uniref:ABC transporter permease n=1 Tax=Romboutsia sedimentorum TaxID=1368474 RepID=UPI0024DEE02B|nr:ABC transporter permease [Romboutsia sedimentorum]MDK2585294.1 ABC transporter permease [Romboutsia sedimentorum]